MRTKAFSFKAELAKMFLFNLFFPLLWADEMLEVGNEDTLLIAADINPNADVQHSPPFTIPGL